jgi:hypothetical protein
MDIKADIERMNRILDHIEGISDERDSVPILLAVRELWPLIRDQINLMNAALDQIIDYTNECSHPDGWLAVNVRETVKLTTRR